MCYIVLYYDQKNCFVILDSKYKNKILQNVVYLVIGVAQGIITAFLLKIGLNFNVENVFAYYVISTDSNFIAHNVMIIILYIIGFSACTFIIEAIKTRTKKNN